MPSSNPRYSDPKKRARALRLVYDRAKAGEPCGICHQPIDLTFPKWWRDPRDNKRKLTPWSLECDEIVPVSLGGSPYDPENIQPAHRICNQIKGNRTQRKATQETEGLQALRSSQSRDGTTTRTW